MPYTASSPSAMRATTAREASSAATTEASSAADTRPRYTPRSIASDTGVAPIVSVGGFDIVDIVWTSSRIHGKGDTMDDVSAPIHVARTVRAPRGPHRTCANWPIEAAYRMIHNKLDREVAENPDELVVYGGIGK